jgi:hypothetical protein
MANLWVYDSGAWVEPRAVYAANSAGVWKAIRQIYLYRDNAWQEVFDQEFVPTTETAVSVLRAAVNIEPHKTYWNQTVDGRKLGDLSGNGVIQSQDALEMSKYVAGNFAGMVPGAQAWVESTVIPFATVDPPPSI